MDIGLLDAFLAAADRGSFSAGARSLMLTQSAMSRRMATLEEALGVRLFDRAQRAVRLTSEGSALLSHARRVVAARDDFVSAAGALTGLQVGTLRLSGLPSMVVTELVPLVGAFHRYHPDIRLVVGSAEDASEVQEGVATGRFDAALTDLKADYPGLAVIPVGQQSLLAVFPPGTRLASSRAGLPFLRARDLASRALVTLPRGTSTRSLTDAIYAELEVTPRHVIDTTQRDALVPLVLSGTGVTFVADALARDAERHGAVLARPTSDAVRTFGFVYRPENLSAALAAFLRLAARRSRDRGEA